MKKKHRARSSRRQKPTSTEPRGEALVVRLLTELALKTKQIRIPMFNSETDRANAKNSEKSTEGEMRVVHFFVASYKPRRVPTLQRVDYG